MKKRRRVLVLESSMHYTGALKSIISIARNLRRDFDFFFAVPNSPFVENLLREQSFVTIRISYREIRKSISALLYLPSLLINTIKLNRVVRANGIEIVHTNDLYNMCGVLLKIFNPSIKLIYSIRLLSSSYVRFLYPVWRFAIVRFADEIICVSHSVRKDWPACNKIHVLFDFVEMEEKLPAKTFKREAPRFLYLANFSPGKGHEFAIMAFKEVVRVEKEATLLLVGGDLGTEKNKKHKSSLQALSSTLGIAAHVVFKDFESAIESEFKEADVFLNFSEGESFSMTCLEALHFGTPCIATDCGGPAEIIIHSETGWLVPVKDVKAMTIAMLALCQNIKLQMEFSTNGKMRARQIFNPENQSKKFQEIYNR